MGESLPPHAKDPVPPHLMGFLVWKFLLDDCPKEGPPRTKYSIAIAWLLRYAASASESILHDLALTGESLPASILIWRLEPFPLLTDGGFDPLTGKGRGGGSALGCIVSTIVLVCFFD